MTGQSLTPAAPGLCYLCGEPLVGRPVNRDHVPPDQIFAKALRRDHALSLTTVPVHRDCNSAYKLDEEYFVQTLVPFARGSVAGNAIFAKTIEEFHAGNRKTVSLVHRVLNSFEERPGGVYLPNGKVALRIEGDRFWRVVWKIVRGLHFVETGEVMPAEWSVSYSVIIPGEPEPAHFAAFMQLSREDFGAHKGVFAYRREIVSTSPPLAYWALLFWDKVILTAAFHPLTCGSDKCDADRAAASPMPLAGGTKTGP